MLYRGGATKKRNILYPRYNTHYTPTCRLSIVLKTEIFFNNSSQLPIVKWNKGFTLCTKFYSQTGAKHVNSHINSHFCSQNFLIFSILSSNISNDSSMQMQHFGNITLLFLRVYTRTHVITLHIWHLHSDQWWICYQTCYNLSLNSVVSLPFFSCYC